MHVAFIYSPFFYPELISTGKYNTSLAEGLVSTGWSVYAVCSHPLYPTWKPCRSNLSIPGITPLRGGRYNCYPKNTLLKRAILELWFFFHSTIQTIKKRNEIDLVIAIYPPSLFMLGVSLIIPKKSPVLGIVHDLQGVYAITRPNIVRKLIRDLIHWVERRAFQRCDHLIFLSETMREISIREYGLKFDKTSVFYPFINIQDVSRTNMDSLDDIFPSDGKSIVYSGALGEKQAPEQLIQLILALLDSFPEMHALIFSQGPIFESLKKSSHHPRLKFHSLVDQINLPELLHRSDIQIIPQATNTSDGSLPSKLPNLIAARTKILCISDPNSEIGAIINQYSLGAVSYSWDISRCIELTEHLLALSSCEPTHEDKFILDKFSFNRLITHINDISGGS